jgi:Uma2 family endonuclease
MNEQLRHPLTAVDPPTTTQVADGLPRRAWTGAELQKMIEAGIIEHGEPFELLGGELVAKVNKGIPHETLKIVLNEFWGKIRPEHIRVAPESALRLGAHDEPEPEFFIFPKSIPAADVRGDTVLLVIEIADSSLAKDRSLKMLRYAAHGVREYWVINARTRATTIFQQPQSTGYSKRTEAASSERLVPLLVPELAVCLADLE